MSTEGDNIKSDYCPEAAFSHILAALMPENRLAIEVSLSTGLRIGDVLNMRVKDLKERMTIREQKTGKTRRIRLSRQLLDALIANSGKIYVFEHRNDYRKHRTRQAVNKDMKRAAELYRVRGYSLSPHSARKIYSVGAYKRTCDIEKVRDLLNHSSESVTQLYALADVITERSASKRSASPHLPQ